MHCGSVLLRYLKTCRHPKFHEMREFLEMFQHIENSIQHYRFAIDVWWKV